MDGEMKIGYKINGRPVTQEEFALSQQAGRLAEMLEAGQPPMSLTDREFLEGHANGSQFDGQEFVGDYYKGIAAKAGVDVKGKVYLSGLAAFPGDPEAWVSGRGDLARVAEKRGWGVQGAVDVPLTNVAEPTGGGVADSIVEDKVLDIVESSEEPIKDIGELKHEVREKLKPHWAK
jgi:hypothetical protein